MTSRSFFTVVVLLILFSFAAILFADELRDTPSGAWFGALSGGLLITALIMVGTRFIRAAVKSS